MQEKTSVTANGLLWFGAGISIAEILTGTLLAPLGFTNGLIAILIGHVIGGVVMLGAGLIGAHTGRNAMETVAISFGRQGFKLFAGLHVIQLIGWTAVMVASGAAAANVIAGIGTNIWSIIIGAFIALWIVLGLKNLGRVNVIVIAALFLLTVVLSYVVFRGDAPSIAGDMTMGAAIELAVAMPLSWLPIISDYTSSAKHPVKAAFVSCGTYFVASCWMFVIGMGAAIYTGESDIALIMLQAGLGAAGIFVVLLSTVTTTFLDAFSAGVSASDIARDIPATVLALIATAIGVILAIVLDVSSFEDFLYLIGSVFAPMTAILLTDFFLLGEDHSRQNIDWLNLLLWIAGFALYRCLLTVETPCGITFPVIVVIMIASFILHTVKNRIM